MAPRSRIVPIENQIYVRSGVAGNKVERQTEQERATSLWYFASRCVARNFELKDFFEHVSLRGGQAAENAIVRIEKRITFRDLAREHRREIPRKRVHKRARNKSTLLYLVSAGSGLWTRGNVSREGTTANENAEPGIENGSAFVPLRCLGTGSKRAGL